MTAAAPVRRTPGGERGVTVVMFGVSAMVLMVVVALVVDISALRDDRRADQKVADAAASAGALMLATENGNVGCKTALQYLEANIDGASFSGDDCDTGKLPDGTTAAVPAFCNPATQAVTVTRTAGSFRVQVVHPVPDTHQMMKKASAIGAPAAAVTSLDGSQCERMGVKVELTRAPSFGRVVSDADQTTSVHAVAKANTTVGGYRPINLLILEREECKAVTIGGNPEVVVGAITGKNGEILPGILAVDSVGSDAATCGTSGAPLEGTLSGTGNSAYLHADGPASCPTEVTDDPRTSTVENMAGQGIGCGIIELFAPGVPGPATPLFCGVTSSTNKPYWPACTSTAYMRPHPLRMFEQRTRAPVDHHFNCKQAYAASVWFDKQKIGGCEDYLTIPPYVDELFTFANGNSTGFNVYSGPCTVEGQATVSVPEGNWLVPCPTFTVKTSATFHGGNVIFAGDVIVTSGGVLTINKCGQEGVNNCAVNSIPTDWERGDPFNESHYSSDAAWVVFRNGAGLQKFAQGSIYMYDTAVFLPRDAELADPVCKQTDVAATCRAMMLTGGSGTLKWLAPREGPFDVLSMWSDAVYQHDLGGGSGLEMEGVYFAPVAKLLFRGSTAQDQVSAQLIVKQLEVNGGGKVTVIPNIDRSLNHFIPPESALLR